MKRAGSANLDRGLGGGSVLKQPKMAGKRRTDEQTFTQESHGGVQVEGMALTDRMIWYKLPTESVHPFWEMVI